MEKQDNETFGFEIQVSRITFDQHLCLRWRFVEACRFAGFCDFIVPGLQTYGVQLKNSSAVEMCTFVCKVKEDSVAESAGLTAGEPPTSYRPYRFYAGLRTPRNMFCED